MLENKKGQMLSEEELDAVTGGNLLQFLGLDKLFKEKNETEAPHPNQGVYYCRGCNSYIKWINESTPFCNKCASDSMLKWIGTLDSLKNYIR